MQLRNRMVKADFWTDTELMKNLPLAGRMMYKGLWHLAEDSGCLENDPTAFKVQLFPLDAEVTLEKIEEWLDILVSIEKLITYGKNDRYMYIKNFHKHQTLNSPGQPGLPLPEWVEYVPNKKKRVSGGYIIHLEKMPVDTESMGNGGGMVTVGNVSGVRTESVQKPSTDRTVTNKKLKEVEVKRSKNNTHTDQGIDLDQDQRAREEEPAHEEKNEKPVSGCVDDDFENKPLAVIARNFERIFAQPLPPVAQDELLEFVDGGMDPPVVVEALKRGMQKKLDPDSRRTKPYRYAVGVLRNWYSRGVSTMEDVTNDDREFEAERSATNGDNRKVSGKNNVQSDRYEKYNAVIEE